MFNLKREGHPHHPTPYEHPTRNTHYSYCYYYNYNNNV